MTKHIHLVRHATADETSPPRYMGSTDIGLTQKGIRQAEALKEELKKRRPDICICSPMQRAMQTAQIAAASLNLPIEIKSDLREIDFGRWEMKTFQQIQQEEPENVERWVRHPNDFCFPGGECINDFYDRIGKVADSLLEHKGSKTAVVTHGGVIQTLICHLIGLPPAHRLAFRIDLASLSTIEMEQEHGRLSELNYTDHLIDRSKTCTLPGHGN